jgi:hypothetical protein
MIDATDRTALLRQGITVTNARRTNGRLHLFLSGGDEERVRAAVAARLGGEVDVCILDELPRRLRPRGCSGHIEREPGRLQLRYVLWGGECMGDIVVFEDARSVVILGLICEPVGGDAGEPREFPFHVYLDRPLGTRTVYDGCGGGEVPVKDVYAAVEVRR